ncbi:MAG: putative spermidine/putrescine transport system substrate-binding protein [Saliniramus fredricksonii]|uniref:Spermidine/putrescine transport system substrate-binding protein n=1 Tax=Saliniramus fredricksonii TaxID=1653334 RepID=A0A0P7XAF9_9HYPH|nr:ABC transporter substrate-binding protein [Saliniramus fredricksonii]KPQ12236.1 MAG: putative spermidine/putrescine transport system substrate-binding protein [Saliniramus fredricksonii]SCC78923.1 putative spermidine/putrescine transport system substrate-binding protein [Saliniramus fredricksonii]
MSMKKLSILAGGVAAAAISAGAYAQEPVNLTIVSWGGAYTESQVRAYHEPYMEENPNVEIINDDGSANALAGLRAQSQAGNVTWDLVDMLPSDAQLACDEGIILPIDHDEMLAPAPDGTPASEDFLPGSLGECFIPQIVYSTILAYNTDLFPEDAQPDAIEALFDVENYPGRRALQDRPGTNLEWALYADGVAPEDIYDVLATPEGQDRAFAKLDTIKEHIVFWTEGAQAPQLLADEEVVMATGYNGRIFNAAQVEGQPFDIIWDGQIVEWDGWVVPADGDNVDAVMDYLYYATDTQRLADQAKFISYGPARASSAPLVGEHADLGIDMNEHMPTNPDNYYSPIVLDNDFWTDYGDELRERFANWMLQ